MAIPFEPIIIGIKINVHLILEYLAFFVAFRYYLFIRKRTTDTISDKNRLSIIVGATFGALIGSRVIGYAENPLISIDTSVLIELLNTKSIMGGLFGGMLGVELVKKIIGEKQSSGDLFTFPIIIGIIIGRVGCFLSGVKEFTYGEATNSIFGMDLGDGIHRHPTSLYEILFLVLLFLVFKRVYMYTKHESGLLFKIFMMVYFGFRFLIEFLKPNVFYVIGLSSIQWLCIVCYIYYIPTFRKKKQHAY